MKKMAGCTHLQRGLLFLLAACLAVVFGGCRKEEVEETQAGELPSITGKKVVMVVASNNFRDEELFEPRELMKGAGAEVDVASSSLQPAQGMKGATFKPDVLLKDVKADDYNAVVFVGGSGAQEYWDDPAAQSLAKAAAEKGKLVCAICIAPVTLANAGLLEGKKATVWSGEAAKLKAKGAKYTGRDVQVDGNFITANGPASSTNFGRAIVRALAR